MKKLILFIVLIVMVQFAKAQSDSVAISNQQKSIIQNVNKYVGHPFSVLYSDLTIKPKTVRGFISSKNKYIERAHNFYYEVPDSIGDVYIYIEWQTPPLETETQQYQQKYTRNFNTQEYGIYSNLIIKKLEVYSK